MTMKSEEHSQLKERIERLLSEYGPWIWNDLSRILVLVWKDDIVSMMEVDPKLLSSEGFLNGLWREKVTDPERIYKVFLELQSNNNSNLILMAKKKSQKVSILKHLQRGKSLTQLQALKLFGCMRLAVIIDRLRSDHNISMEIMSPDKYGKYTLIE